MCDDFRDWFMKNYERVRKEILADPEYQKEWEEFKKKTTPTWEDLQMVIGNG